MIKLYNIEEAARILHLTVAGLRTLRHKNEGPVGVKVGRRVMWTQESLNRYLQELQADADREREAVQTPSSGRTTTEQKAVR